jgi:hypothetical protein
MQPRRYRNTGKPPRDKSIVIQVQYGNDVISEPHPAGWWAGWDHLDGPWSIKMFWRADGLGEEEERKVG